MAHEILLFLVPNITVASKDTGKPNVLIDFVKHTENLLWKKKKGFIMFKYFKYQAHLMLVSIYIARTQSSLS